MPATKIISAAPAKLPARPRKGTPRVDGWNNLLTGMGRMNQDKRMSTTFSAKSFMDEYELLDLYVDDGFAKRVVNLLPEEMMRKPFTVEGDSDNLIYSKLEEIKGLKEIERLLKWNRLFGGAICVMGIDDGGDLEMPVNEQNIRDVIFLRTYERYRATWTTTDLYNDPKQRKYGEVQWYTIYPVNGLQGFRVHESRCLVMQGMDIPEQARSLNSGWGTSYLQHCYEQLRSLGNVYGGLESIVDDFVFGTLSVQGLQDLIASGREDVVKERLELMDLSRHIINTVLLDEHEKYEKHASTVTGLPEIVDKFYEALSAVTQIPMRMLKGNQAQGLNNKGEAETEDWYNAVSTAQVNDYKPILETVSRFIMLSKKGPFRGVEPADWKIKFTPLKQLTEKETAEIRKIHSETDKNYIDSGVLDPAEVALSRFGGETYGEQIELVSDRTPADELGGGAEPTEGEKLELEAQKIALKQSQPQKAVPPKPKTVR